MEIQIHMRPITRETKYLILRRKQEKKKEEADRFLSEDKGNRIKEKKEKKKERTRRLKTEKKEKKKTRLEGPTKTQTKVGDDRCIEEAGELHSSNVFLRKQGGRTTHGNFLYCVISSTPLEKENVTIPDSASIAYKRLRLKRQRSARAVKQIGEKKNRQG